MDAGSIINRHGLHNGKGLNGRVANRSKEESGTPRSARDGRVRQVSAVQLVRGIQAADQVTSGSANVRDIKEKLSWHLPLDAEGPVLNIGRATIPWENRVRGPADIVILIDEGGSGKMRSRPTSRKRERGQQSCYAGALVFWQVVYGIESALATAASVGAVGPASRVENSITSTQNCLGIQGIGQPDAWSESLGKSFRGGAPIWSCKDHRAQNIVSGVHYSGVHPGKLVERVHDGKDQVVAKANIRG